MVSVCVCVYVCVLKNISYFGDILQEFLTVIVTCHEIYLEVSPAFLNTRRLFVINYSKELLDDFFFFFRAQLKI